MTRSSKRWTRWIAAPALAAALGLGLAPSPARAQLDVTPPEGGEGDKSGRPLDGYLATAVFAGLALFIVGKTARR